MIMVKPGFHIIAGITRIAEKLVQRSWRSQRSTGFHMITENRKEANVLDFFSIFWTHIELIYYIPPVPPAIHLGILILVIFAKFIAQTVILLYSLHEISSNGRLTSHESHFKL